ncbi:C40 family peptidase [Chitinophaga pinensis]|uniref:NLP/P60 protein n=1 Tax=Chitinophaga pinensis (strain ATCC 43595 / DSM 2588 / LMG 13176 / NBRC 15968 / NCIMB 11800 / UQM 2034) TaxID=485918 RepID=A0A979GXE0_CHIPD|nr:C40 family peptidase [Chitinophaga pinensis]ACU61115.1 NLP/P60 protein [Chitinophaga pinensis DSM 2588]
MKKLLPIIISVASITTVAAQIKKKPVKHAPAKKHTTAYHKKATTHKSKAVVHHKVVTPPPMPDSLYFPNSDITVNTYDTSGLRNNIKQLFAVLESELGKPYIRGAIGPMAFDCSGLIKFGFSFIGMTLPRTAAEMSNLGNLITVSDFTPGDLLFFTGRSTKSKVKRVAHVGCVYKVDNGKVLMIHSSNQGVNIVDITNSEYYKKRFIAAKRVIEVDSTNTVIPMKEGNLTDY